MSALEHKNRFYTLLGVALALFLGALDQTIVSTAMPRIVARLSGLDRFTWVFTIYLLISTLLVPIYGKLADIRSRRGLEIFSVSLFLIGSALCGLAGEFGPWPLIGDGMNQLIVFRGIQGLGGAGIFALAFIIVADLYPPRERGKINGMFGAVFGLASVLGPLAGGFLTDHAGAWLPPIDGWRWVFYVNIPLGVVALWFIIKKMPHMHAKDHSHKINYGSVALMLATFLPLVLGLQLDKQVYPWTSPLILSLLGTAGVMMIIWIWHSLRTEHPILNLHLFKTKIFSTANIATFFFGGSFLTIIIFLPQYMVNVMGVSATGAGASIIPMSLGIVFGASVSGPLVSKIGKYKAILIIGALITLLGMTLLSTLSVSSPMWQVIVYMILVGIGFGPAQSLYALAVQNTINPREIGQATSTVQFSRQIGSVICAAFLGVVFSTTLTTAFSANLPAGSAGSGLMSSRQMDQGPTEIRAQILAGFDSDASDLTALFALRGDAIEPALQAYLAKPTLRPEIRDQLKNGTPAQIIGRGFDAFIAQVKVAVLAGDASALNQIMEAGKSLPDGTPGPSAHMPGIAKMAILRELAKPAVVRQRQWPNIEEQFRSEEENAINNVSTIALDNALAGMNTAKLTVADTVVSGIEKSFTSAVTRVWFFSIFIVLGTLGATILLPSVKLRGRGEAPVVTES